MTLGRWVLERGKAEAGAGRRRYVGSLAYIWHWLSTTRYTRLLEDRVARLEAENEHLRNAIYARAGIGPVLLNTAPLAERSTDKRIRQPIGRPISWSQVKQKLESAAAHRQSASDPRAQSS